MALRTTTMAALLFLSVCYGEATKYTVGDTKHWALEVNYTAWASDKTFHVGDILVFIYSAEFHNVLEVNQSAYSSCLASHPLKE
ncbi:hypothetical protein SUGI_0989060 [Cryptomeria japonica]|nr:hypothetical protein SUGI_0989060 [Cryptomeria japonica]